MAQGIFETVVREEVIAVRPRTRPAFTETFDLASLEYQRYRFNGETTDVLFDEKEDSQLRKASGTS